MTTTPVHPPHLEINDHGYPVEDSLKELVTSGHRFADVLEAVRPYIADTYGTYQVTEIAYGPETVIEHRITTGGWSGIEEVLGVLEGTVGWALSWESSRRGGLHVLHMNDVAANMPIDFTTTEPSWGKPAPDPDLWHLVHSGRHEGAVARFSADRELIYLHQTSGAVSTIPAHEHGLHLVPADVVRRMVSA